MAKIDLQLIAENVEEYENLVRSTDWGNLSYDALANLFNRTIQAEQIISDTKPVRPESTWIDGRVKRLEKIVSENKGKIVRVMSNEFSERKKELDLIAGTGIDLLSEKRAVLDELCLAYVSLNNRRIPDKRIREYNFAMKKRGPIQEILRRIKNIYLNGNWQNIETLKRLIKGMLFNNFSLESVIKDFKKIDFYEGITEAKRLQEEIFYFIDNSGRKEKPGIVYTGPVYARPRADDSKKGRETNFLLSEYLEGIGEPRNFGLLKLKEILKGRYKEEWPARLNSFVEELGKINCVFNERDANYMRSIREGLALASQQGELSNVLKENGYCRKMVDNVIEMLGNYTIPKRNELALAY